ncbi:acetone carboxylase subunit gamma [Thermodesulfobacteriota bacterium]
MKITECLVIDQKDEKKIIKCIKCNFEFCSPSENYKLYALRSNRDAYELNLSYKKLDDPDIPVYYQEYYCPGCMALLAVDVWCPSLDDEQPLWDIKIQA